MRLGVGNQRSEIFYAMRFQPASRARRRDRYTFYYDTVEERWRPIPDGMEPVLVSQEDRAKAMRGKQLLGWQGLVRRLEHWGHAHCPDSSAYLVPLLALLKGIACSLAQMRQNARVNLCDASDLKDKHALHNDTPRFIRVSVVAGDLGDNHEWGDEEAVAARATRGGETRF
ncbi:hypothetical protein B0H14DRAFT_2637337 [Mycena olivaceomarginata]|nr:hypothetical protein B0H14DRAFT_2637337 [Mycena olivaceomarginata]